MPYFFPEDALARTDELCAGEPLYAEIRRVLLDLEAQGQRAGWDAPENAPLLFIVERLATGLVQARSPEIINTALFAGLVQGDGQPGTVLTNLADAFELARGRWESRCSARREALGPVGVHGGPPGSEFYGYAFRAEGWSTGPTEDPQALEYAARHELSHYPGRVEIRQVYLAGRDGLTWWVMRHRGREAEVAAGLPESEQWTQAGRIPNALARMTNALAGSHAPVPHRGVIWS